MYDALNNNRKINQMLFETLPEPIIIMLCYFDIIDI